MIITGDSRKSVCLAWSRIHVMVESARVREDFTHFISVPMNAEEMKKAFAQFKDDLIQECGNERGVDKSVFQEEGMLHLTVGTMPLMGKVIQTVLQHKECSVSFNLQTNTSEKKP